MNVPSSTLEGIQETGQSLPSVWARRGFLSVLTVFVVAGGLGFLGVHSATARASEDGWSVSVLHASVARAGLDVPFEIRVRHLGGFGKDITLALTGHYFDIYETQGFEPEPSEATRDAHTLYLTFTAPPKGQELVVSYDAYVQPSSQVGQSGRVGVMDGDQELATVRFETALLP